MDAKINKYIRSGPYFWQNSTIKDTKKYLAKYLKLLVKNNEKQFQRLNNPMLVAALIYNVLNIGLLNYKIEKEKTNFSKGDLKGYHYNEFLKDIKECHNENHLKILYERILKSDSMDPKLKSLIQRVKTSLRASLKEWMTNFSGGINKETLENIESIAKIFYDCGVFGALICKILNEKIKYLKKAPKKLQYLENPEELSALDLLRARGDVTGFSDDDLTKLIFFDISQLYKFTFDRLDHEFSKKYFSSNAKAFSEVLSTLGTKMSVDYIMNIHKNAAFSVENEDGKTIPDGYRSSIFLTCGFLNPLHARIFLINEKATPDGLKTVSANRDKYFEYLMNDSGLGKISVGEIAHLYKRYSSAAEKFEKEV